MFFLLAILFALFFTFLFLSVCSTFAEKTLKTPQSFAKCNALLNILFRKCDALQKYIFASNTFLHNKM